MIGSKFIKPSSPTPPQNHTYKLSFFDQLAPPAHVPLIYFYPINGEPQDPTNANRITQLETSLSEILTRYYPISGRFFQDGLSVICEDQGVLFVEAKVNTKLEEFLTKAYQDIDLVSLFVPWNIGQTCHVSTPILGVQVTFFECGGMALAVHNTHKLSDGFTGCTFTDEWAKISRSFVGINELKGLNFGMGSVFPARELSGILKPFPAVKPGPKIVTRRLLFDESGISRLKEKVGKIDLGGGIISYPSRVEVVTAVIWRGMIRASQARHKRLKNSITSVAVNLRGKTSPGGTENFFGNFYVQLPVKFMADESKMELQDFVKLIKTTVQKCLADSAKASCDEIFSMAIRFSNEIREAVGDEEVDVRICTSLCRFPIYEADFGWGKPSWVSSANAPFEIFSLMDTKEGDGIEARVNLNEIDMPIFQNDPQVLAFTSSSMEQ